MDIEAINRKGWNSASSANCPWVRPVEAGVIERARRGDWTVTLAGPRSVPKHWFRKIGGAEVLCLAAGGGQQAPVLSAAGASVVSIDISDGQVARDQAVRDEHGLDMECVQGSMTDLSMFPDAAFDVVFNPVSVVYVDDVHGVWRECYRVLKPDGRLMMGSINPLNFLFEENEGVDDVGLLVRYALPFVEENALDEHALQAALDRNMVFCRSHTLEDLIGGQTRAGFVIADFYESRREDERAPSINRYCPTYFATLALKLP